MKKIVFALLGMAILSVGCTTKEQEPYQNPYRIIVDYLPQTVTIDGISGTVTPDADYDWITSNGNGSFTVRRNTTGLIRRAEFTISGKSDKAIVNQRAHGLDALVSSKLSNKDADAQTAEMTVTFSTEFADDYESWGYVFGQSMDISANKEYPQGKFAKGDQTVTLTGVDPEQSYYFWGYAVSTEGDKVYSPVFGIAKPVTVKAGEDVQAIYNEAPEFAEVRVEGGVVINGPFFLRDNVKLSGGWNSSFDKQDLNNRTIIDGGGKRRALVSGITETGDRPGFKDACINGFEIRNGLGSNVVFNGKLTVEFCYIHHGSNSDKGGGVMATESEGDELVLANSIIAWNKADAHAGGVSVSGAGTKVTVVNCLFRGNASIAQYGYTAAIHGQSGVQAYVANCTFVDNVNWRDGSSATSSPWSAVMFRNKGTHIEFVNNVSAGNWYFLPGVADKPDEHPDRYDMPIKPEFILEQQVQQCDMNVLGSGDYDENWVFQSNVICGADPNNFIGRAGNGDTQKKAQDNCTFVPNDDFKTLFVNYDAGDFHPAGAMLTTGENSAAAKSILGTYMTDLDGNPRITGGKINAGCYQAQ
ncbi:MAG: hypothetical protein IJ611_07610 [Bacteroidales bacterium]|nr:hypothetical protein [Bacteroidales bacterium]